MFTLGYDNNEYIRRQSEHIRERIRQFGGKLYLEFGGKLFDDNHAARVLPGFQPDSKVKMLLELKEQAEIVIAINANAIESNKKRGDLGITYDMEVLRLIDAFRDIGLYVGSVVITQYSDQPVVAAFYTRLENLGIRVYKHYTIQNYPMDIPMIISDEGFGRNEYIETSRSLIVVTGPGPGSGKMSSCLSQLYHEKKRGISAGYAKFETFPIWNLPLEHPVNIAYEAATADLADQNVIDPFHHQAYGEVAVNYNRDVDIFPVVSSIFRHINADGQCPYKSPTDMGVNMVGHCITDDEVCRAAAKQEIIRRYYAARCLVRQGLESPNTVRKLEVIMKKADVSLEDRPIIATALQIAEETGEPAAAMVLPDGRIVTGKTKDLLGASSALLLNALKALADIPDETLLISKEVIEPVQKLKTQHLGNVNPRLHTDEVLIALSICGGRDELAAKALDQLDKLRGCDAHSTVILAGVDEDTFRRIGINMTCEPKYQKKKLYHK